MTRSEILDVPAVAAWLMAPETTVRLHARALGGFRVGKSWRFTASGVEAWIASRQQPQAAPITVLPVRRQEATRPRRRRDADRAPSHDELFPEAVS